jgi:hypothetical protein
LPRAKKKKEEKLLVFGSGFGSLFSVDSRSCVGLCLVPWLSSSTSSLVSDRFQRHWLPTGVFRPKATTRKINQTIDSLFLSSLSIHSGKKKTRKSSSSSQKTFLKKEKEKKLIKVRLHRFSENSILIWSASSFQFAFWVNRCVSLCFFSARPFPETFDTTRKKNPKKKN